MPNLGIDLAKEKLEQSSEDWMFGSVSVKGLAEGVKLRLYIPDGEIQFGKDDFMDCASRSPHNILETKLTYAVKGKLLSPETIDWLKDKGYADKNGKVTLSDRFTAILSGTTKQGNSLKAPMDSIRKNGCIPKKMLPAGKDMTWEDYHNKADITDEMIDLGKKFAEIINVNYVRVHRDDFSKINDMLNVAGHAWEEPINGIYPNTSQDFNHAFALFPPVIYEAIDNYYDKVDGDFIKRLSPDYLFYDYGYRVIVNEGKVIKSVLEKIIEVMQQLLALLSQKKSMTNNELLHQLAVKKLGTDFTPDFPVPDEYSCALAVTTLLNEINPDIPIQTYTKTLYEYMKSSPLFREIEQPIKEMKPGWICISPTEYASRPDIIPNGHIGIYYDATNIMSNDSRTGLWETNFTRDSWRARYHYRGGYPIYVFELV